MKKENRKIKIVLHHDYLLIEDELGGEKRKVQVPIRTAKLISDMWIASGNTDQDIENYAIKGGKWEGSNPDYDLGLYVRRVGIDNVFQWQNKKINKI